jgi:hypothetical protein
MCFVFVRRYFLGTHGMMRPNSATDFRFLQRHSAAAFAHDSSNAAASASAQRLRRINPNTPKGRATNLF